MNTTLIESGAIIYLLSTMVLLMFVKLVWNNYRGSRKHDDRHGYGKTGVHCLRGDNHSDLCQRDGADNQNP